MGRGFWGATIRDNKLMAVRGTRTSGEAMELILPGRGWIPNSAVSTLKLGRVTSPEIRVRSRTSMSPRPFLGWAATDSVAARRQSLHTPALGGSGCARPILELLGRQGITASSPAIRVAFLGLPKDIGTMCGLGSEWFGGEPGRINGMGRADAVRKALPTVQEGWRVGRGIPTTGKE